MEFLKTIAPSFHPSILPPRLVSREVQNVGEGEEGGREWNKSGATGRKCTTYSCIAENERTNNERRDSAREVKEGRSEGGMYRPRSKAAGGRCIERNEHEPGSNRETVLTPPTKFIRHSCVPALRVMA